MTNPDDNRFPYVLLCTPSATSLGPGFVHIHGGEIAQCSSFFI
jgi:hypothetical protein